MEVQATLIKPTGLYLKSLRRYASYTCPNGYHNAKIKLYTVNQDLDSISIREPSEKEKALYEWPMFCGSCSYEFAPTDAFQLYYEQLYSSDNGVTSFPLREAPPSSIYEATWLQGEDVCVGLDGKAYFAVLPNGDTWHIDGRASNCTLPHDTAHKCWCRHGEAPNFTVDKNGVTCSAGAGSIASGNYHGFLTNGKFT